MTAEEIDKEIARKRWSAYPLLVDALKGAISAFAEVNPAKKDYGAIDRAVHLLVILGEKELR